MRPFFYLSLLSLLTAFVLISGCKTLPDVKSDSVRPVESITESVSQLSKADAKGFAQAYAEEIRAAKGKMGASQKQLKELTPAELSSAKASTIKAEFAQASMAVSSLLKRYELYVKRYVELGGKFEEVAV